MFCKQPITIRAIGRASRFPRFLPTASDWLTALFSFIDNPDDYKFFLVLAEELDNVRTLFMEKEKELAIAVAKVESLTRQLDKQRKGWSQSSPSREKTHQELELERLRKELMVRMCDITVYNL